MARTRNPDDGQEKGSRERRPPPVAVVQPLHGAVRHGKKRRSSKKRHDVDVLRELELARPVAKVADLGDRRAAKSLTPSAFPSSAPPTWRGLWQRAVGVAKEAAELAWEVVTAPVTIARLLARNRERAA